MQLPSSLVKEFANALRPKTSRSSERSVYGTVTSHDDGMYVRLDGSDVDTPVTASQNAEVGDRVIVMVKDRKAVITGNLTAPASAQADNLYMRFTSEGLRIGVTDGVYILITSTGYKLCDSDGTLLSSSSSSEMVFNEGDAVLRAIEGVLYLIGENSIGLRTSYTSGNDTYRAEVVAEAKSASPGVALQITKNGESYGSITIRNGIIRVTGDKYGLMLNGYPVLTSQNLMLTGTLKITGVAKAKSITHFKGIPNNFEGNYYLAGIREIHVYKTSTGKRSSALSVNQFYTNPSTLTVGAVIYNLTAEDIEATVRIEWFAFMTDVPKDLGEETIDIGDGGETESD